MFCNTLQIFTRDILLNKKVISYELLQEFSNMIWLNVQEVSTAILFFQKNKSCAELC